MNGKDSLIKFPISISGKNPDNKFYLMWTGKTTNSKERRFVKSEYFGFKILIKTGAHDYT